MDGRVERARAGLERLERQSRDHIGRAGDAASAGDGLGTDRRDQLRAVDQSQPLLRLQRDRAQTELAQNGSGVTVGARAGVPLHKKSKQQNAEPWREEEANEGVRESRTLLPAQTEPSIPTRARARAERGGGG